MPECTRGCLILFAYVVSCDVTLQGWCHFDFRLILLHLTKPSENNMEVESNIKEESLSRRERDDRDDRDRRDRRDRDRSRSRDRDRERDRDRDRRDGEFFRFFFSTCAHKEVVIQ